MDWTNDYIIDFLEHFEKESIIYDENHKHHKNRVMVQGAWKRIRDALSFECTIEKLKRKKNSLMTQYRECLRKIRDSSKTASRAEEVHQPAWFAFDTMHRFLGDIYEKRETFNTEVYLLPDDSDLDNQYRSESQISWPPVRENIKKEDSDLLSVNSVSVESDEDSPVTLLSGSSSLVNVRRRQTDQGPIAKKRVVQIDNDNASECDIYGQLLAKKLKRMDEEDRLRLMNDIDNLTYKHLMNVTMKNQ